ncbi:uncharacterized protein LOC130712917 [Lotus japonicus]|uniref:uncharacterized protein LOC130712917 n=1 Tax=Lotus japonicus TaxID=34305 RepID=UPI002590E6BD|nr:uncharacterized protein LOC130712917 [Lotus japonicus]
MTQDSGKKIAAGPKPIKNSHGVEFLGLKTASSTPSRVTRSSAKIVSPESSGPAKRTRSMRIKHVIKRSTGKASSVQDISEDSIPDPPVDDNQESDVVDAEADQDDRDSEPNSEANPSEPDAEKEDDTDGSSQESSSKKTPSVEIPHEKTPEPLSKKGKKQVYVASEEEDSDDQEVHKKVTTSASQKATVSTSKNVAGFKEKKKKVSVPEKKTKKDKKDEKIAASTRRKRKHVAETDSEPNVEPDVPDITTTAKKRIKGKRIPLNVPEAPIDNVSFHFASYAQSWKFVVQKRLAIKRELHADALELKEIMELLVHAGLMKTVKDIGRCFSQLVREFIVNIPTEDEILESVALSSGRSMSEESVLISLLKLLMSFWEEVRLLELVKNLI